MAVTGAIQLLSVFAVFFQGVLSQANQPPTLLEDMDGHRVDEVTPVGSLVYKLVGIDPDRDPVTFGIDGTSVFRVDATTGDVYLNEKLDRESQSSLTFYVTIEDRVGDGNPNNFVRHQVTVLIHDANDNAPVFHDTPYVSRVRER
ncbi:PREDICTED: cadherin-87A-like [Priapulus caudatus]|uniref:Cadherin-87A-like n=1 Tax=Priapulus caudatus TaxID=37621 RepID=A0ABM1F450_PRICU|nr:PREDICTED: cadherin-87A-like [Priapulus caudatus]